MIVTARELRRMGACVYDLRKFRRMWPHGCRTTFANLRRAKRCGLAVGWFVDHLLDRMIFVPSTGRRGRRIRKAWNREAGDVITYWSDRYVKAKSFSAEEERALLGLDDDVAKAAFKAIAAMEKAGFTLRKRRGR